MNFQQSYLYWLAGIVLLIVAIMSWRDKANPRRLTTGLFWGVYGLLFLLGDWTDIYKAMIDGEANASVELTPNMAGPAFDALEKFKKDGTMPEKVTITKSTLYLPDTAKEELEKKKNMGY